MLLFHAILQKFVNFERIFLYKPCLGCADSLTRWLTVSHLCCADHSHTLADTESHTLAVQKVSHLYCADESHTLANSLTPWLTQSLTPWLTLSLTPWLCRSVSHLSCADHSHTLAVQITLTPFLYRSPAGTSQGKRGTPSSPLWLLRTRSVALSALGSTSAFWPTSSSESGPQDCMLCFTGFLKPAGLFYRHPCCGSCPLYSPNLCFICGFFFGAGDWVREIQVKIKMC